MDEISTRGWEEKRYPLGGNIGEEPYLECDDTPSILNEAERFEELAIRTISRSRDGLPFAICVMDPETIHKNEPHVHLFEPKRKGKDLMMRLEIYPDTPRKAEDIRDAFPIRGKYEAIPDEWKPLIVAWASQRNKMVPKLTNWENLWAQWIYSVGDW